jgi:hypothetical protein
MPPKKSTVTNQQPPVIKKTKEVRMLADMLSLLGKQSYNKDTGNNKLQIMDPNN